MAGEAGGGVSFQYLPTLADMQRTRRATPKYAIEPRELTQAKKKQAKLQNEKTFRAAVWKRDKGKCRATGVKLVKSGTVDPHALGEVDHTLLRSTHPDKVYDVANGVLIQKFLNRLRKRSCSRAPQFKYFDYDGPADRGLPQTFVWRDADGTITKTRIG